MLTIYKINSKIIKLVKASVTSGWRNRQTRTFEGRMVNPCEFKSHPRHQREGFDDLLFFCFHPAASGIFLSVYFESNRKQQNFRRKKGGLNIEVTNEKSAYKPINTWKKVKRLIGLLTNCYIFVLSMAIDPF